MLPVDNSIVGLPGFEVLSIEGVEAVRIRVKYVGEVQCPGCQGVDLRTKDTFERVLRHASLGTRPCWLHVEAHKYLCRGCGRYFNQRFPGIGVWRQLDAKGRANRGLLSLVRRHGSHLTSWR